MSDKQDAGWFEAYKGLGQTFKAYWNAYGGLASVLKSPYMHLSVLISAVSFRTWFDGTWWTQPLSILPNLLGFSLGGYAIWLALGDEKFRMIISGQEPTKRDGKWVKSEEHSPFMEVSATFAHFVVVQLAALLFAIIASNLAFVPEAETFAGCIASIPGFRTSVYFASAVGYWLFTYALVTALAAGLAIFTITSWYDAHRSGQRVTEARRKEKDQETQ